jgi:hypothetical protein
MNKLEVHKMITNITYEKFEEKNEKLRLKLDRLQCIKIKDVTETGSAYGGALVVYDDYRTRTRGEAAIQDIIDWVRYGEIYVDTGKVLLQKYFKSEQEKEVKVEAIDLEEQERQLVEKAVKHLKSKGIEIVDVTDKIAVRVNGEISWYTAQYILNNM